MRASPLNARVHDHKRKADIAAIKDSVYAFIDKDRVIWGGDVTRLNNQHHHLQSFESNKHIKLDLLLTSWLAVASKQNNNQQQPGEFMIGLLLLPWRWDRQQQSTIHQKEWGMGELNCKLQRHFFVCAAHALELQWILLNNKQPNYLHILVRMNIHS